MANAARIRVDAGRLLSTMITALLYTPRERPGSFGNPLNRCHIAVRFNLTYFHC